VNTLALFKKFREAGMIVSLTNYGVSFTVKRDTLAWERSSTIVEGLRKAGYRIDVTPAECGHIIAMYGNFKL